MQITCKKKTNDRVYRKTTFIQQEDIVASFESMISKYDDITIESATEGFLGDIWNWIVRLFKKLFGISESVEDKVKKSANSIKLVVEKITHDNSRYTEAYSTKKHPQIFTWNDITTKIKLVDDYINHAYKNLNDTCAKRCQPLQQDWDKILDLLTHFNAKDWDDDKITQRAEILQKYAKASTIHKNEIMPLKTIADKIGMVMNIDEENDIVKNISFDLSNFKMETNMTYEEAGWPKKWSEVAHVSNTISLGGLEYIFQFKTYKDMMHHFKKTLTIPDDEVKKNPKLGKFVKLVAEVSKQMSRVGMILLKLTQVITVTYMRFAKCFNIIDKDS